jgi:hypothetical protein
MRTRSKLALMGLGATLLMAFAVSSVSARTLSSSSGNMRVTFQNLELIAEEIATTTCNVTLEGTLHSRTIVKSTATLIGNITRVDTANCNNTVRILRETLPWNIRYLYFSGRLPNITLIGVNVLRTNFLVETLGFGCLAREATIPANFIRNTATGEIREVNVPTTGVPLTGGLTIFGCPSSTGSFRSGVNGNATVLGAATRITVTLI